MSEIEYTCSFCGKGDDKCGLILIRNPEDTEHICSDCVARCNNIINRVPKGKVSKLRPTK